MNTKQTWSHSNSQRTFCMYDLFCKSCPACLQFCSILTTGTLIKGTSHITLCHVWIDLHSIAALKSYRCILHSLAHALMVLDFTPIKTYQMWKDKMANHFRGTPCIKKPWKAATIKGRNAPGLRQTSGLACWAWKMQVQVFKGNNTQTVQSDIRNCLSMSK